MSISNVTRRKVFLHLLLRPSLKVFLKTRVKRRLKVILIESLKGLSYLKEGPRRGLRGLSGHLKRGLKGLKGS